MTQHPAPDAASAAGPAGLCPVDDGRPEPPVPALHARLEPRAGRGWDGFDEQERRLRLDAMEPDALRALAASMPLIEQAKGIIMGCFGCDAAAAFAVLTRVSSAKNVKLRVLAAAVVEAASSATVAPVELAPMPCDQVRRVLLGADDRDHAQDGRGSRIVGIAGARL